ncbi:hypothetical protein ACQPW1_10680 [Nocardia sp. CA-128927]|uniref:hypothetical protein n=1 Tax=Nocardia sp. CA-128927 TaxID=3239975 RepID=UPI003D959142
MTDGTPTIVPLLNGRAVAGRFMQVSLSRNRFAEAEQPLSEALATMRSRHRRFDEAEVLVALGDRALGMADRVGALGYYRAGLGIFTELCFAEQIAEVEALIPFASLPSR